MIAQSNPPSQTDPAAPKSTRKPATGAEKRRAYTGPALFSYGFRPFFLGAGLLAAVAVPVWLCVYLGDIDAFGPLPGVLWHQHEMLFGYLSATIAGFLLTAVPNWTGRLPVLGLRLAGLAGLWLAGRVALIAPIPLPLAGAICLSFLIALAAMIFREVRLGRNAKNYVVCLLIGLLAAAETAFFIGAAQGDPAVGMRLGFGIAMLLMGLIGGRVTPSFTRNWLKARKAARLPVAFGLIDKIALALTAAGAVVWAAAPEQFAAGALWLAAAAATAARLSRWRGLATLAEPLLFALHVSCAWIAVAQTMLALSILAPDMVSTAQAMHAVGAGAIAHMTLAVMSRATLGHTGRPLTAGLATRTLYLAVFAAAAMRIGADWTASRDLVLMISAGLWTLAFTGFCVIYGPLLLKRS